MAKTITECRQAIREIDRKIDAARDDLLSLEKIDRLSSASWEAAWQRHPLLREHERLLFVQRANLNDELRAAEHKALPSFRNPPKCPSCKGSGFARAA